MTKQDLGALGFHVGALLKQRGTKIAVAESSCGGLISSALVAVPGASSYYAGGGVIYTARSFKGILNASLEDFRKRGIRSSSEPFAVYLAEQIRLQHDVEWGLAETGASGPSGNGYGDAAGHACFAVSGPVNLSKTIETGSNDRVANMWTFAETALALLTEALEEPVAA